MLSQENAFSSSDLSFKNSIKYNKFLISPAFSYAREETPTITLVNRRPWMKFENSPNQYYLGYLGKVNNNSRFGVGIFNESVGVLSNFGGIVNYTYNAYLSEDSDLTFGLNLNYYTSSFSLDRIITVEAEPLVFNTESSSFVGIRPGVNLRLSNFDFGISGNNLVLYNLNTSESVKNNQEGSFLGYMMYTYELYNTYGLYADGKLSTLVQVEKKKDATGLSGIVMLDLPYTGWVQGGYNTLQGASAGLGVTISEKFSLGYTYQIGLADASALGSTHELTLAYRFKNYEDTFDYSVQAAKNAKRRNAAVASKPKVDKAQLERDRLAKLEAEKADRERLAKLEQERLAQLERDRLAKIEADRLAAEKAEQDRLAQLERDKLNAGKTEQERLAQLEKDRLAKLAADKLAAEKAEQDRLAKLERDRLAKLAADKAERDRLAKLERDKLNANQAEKERLAQLEKNRLAKLAADKLAADKAEADRLVRLEKDRLAKLAADKLAADKAEQERLAQLERDKLNASKAEQERLAQLEKERQAKIAADKLVADKAEAERLAQLEKDRLAKLAADKLAADKAEAERLAQLEKDRLAKLATDKLAADKAEKERLAQLEKDRLAKLAADKLAADKAEADRLAQLEKDRLAKLAADKLAADKAEKDRLAQLEKDRLAKLAADKLAADKAEAERLAKLNAAKSAEDIKKEQQLAFEKALKEEKANSVLEAYKRDITEKTKNSDNAIKSLDSLVKARELDLQEYLLEDKLTADGKQRAPKKFVSTAESNRQLQELKGKISNSKREYEKLISDFEAANKVRMNEMKNKGLTPKEVNDFNDYYNKILNDLKSKRDNYAEIERKADIKINEIKDAKEAERLRRIKKADFESDEDRKIREQQSLDIIKNNTNTTNPTNAANNDTNGADTNATTDIPIVKNSDTDPGYYLVLGTFSNEAARNEFLAKVVGAGGSNVKIFYNLSNVTYYVYIDKYDSLTEAKNALKQKGTKSYNGKMFIVSVQ